MIESIPFVWYLVDRKYTGLLLRIKVRKNGIAAHLPKTTGKWNIYSKLSCKLYHHAWSTKNLKIWWMITMIKKNMCLTALFSLKTLKLKSKIAHFEYFHVYTSCSNT